MSVCVDGDILADPHILKGLFVGSGFDLRSELGLTFISVRQKSHKSAILAVKMFGWSSLKADLTDSSG